MPERQLITPLKMRSADTNAKGIINLHILVPFLFKYTLPRFEIHPSLQCFLVVFRCYKIRMRGRSLAVHLNQEWLVRTCGDMNQVMPMKEGGCKVELNVLHSNEASLLADGSPVNWAPRQHISSIPTKILVVPSSIAHWAHPRQRMGPRPIITHPASQQQAKAAVA